MLANPSEQCARYAGVACGTEAAFDVSLHTLVSLEITIDKLRRLVRTDAQLCRQAVGRLAVNDAEVDSLRAIPLLSRDRFYRQSQNFSCSSAMDIFAGAECRHQTFITREVRDNSQFHLRIVRRNEPRARLRYNCAANLASEIRAYGDVLQIRIAARQTSRRCASLIECRVQPSRDRIDLLRNHINVRRLEFRKLTVFENETRKVIILRQFFENFRSRRILR